MSKQLHKPPQEHKTSAPLEELAPGRQAHTTSPMSKEARIELMRERHMGTAKVSTVEIELALSLSSVNQDLEARLKPRQDQGMTTTPIDPFELQAHLNALSSEAMVSEDTDDQVDATKRVNIKALLKHLDLQRIDEDVPFTIPIELEDLIVLQEQALAHPHLPQSTAFTTRRLDERDLEVLEPDLASASSVELPLVSMDELLPETTKLERLSLAGAIQGESATTTDKHALMEGALPISLRRAPTPLRIKPAMEDVQEASHGPFVLPEDPQNFSAAKLEKPHTQEQLQTMRLSQLPQAKITPNATPPPLKKLHPKGSWSPQTKNPQIRGRDHLIAAILGVVFVLVGVVLGWMVIQ